MARVAVVGLGFVGLTTALGFAEAGHSVAGLEADPAKREQIASGRVPFHEPGLPEALGRHLGSGFAVAEGVAEALDGAEAVFFCVGTPTGDEGSADLSTLDAAVREVLDAVRGSGASRSDAPVLVIKSTVPPGTCAGHVAAVVRDGGFEPGEGIGLANNPEFLREGVSWEDFTRPDRIVVGGVDEASATRVAALYDGFGCEVLTVSLGTAEFVKYLSNTLLATLISWSNETSMIADAVGGIDVARAFRILHLDRRWSGSPANMTTYAYPGAGFGGYCLPKDTAALAACAREAGVAPLLLDAVLEDNERIGEHVADRILAALPPGGTVGVLGLSFKPGSDDVRESPSARVVRALLDRGVSRVVAYDPMANEAFAEAHRLPLEYATSVAEVAASADVVAVLTAWPEFRERLAELAGVPVLDFRHYLDRERGK